MPVGNKLMILEEYRRHNDDNDKRHELVNGKLRKTSGNATWESQAATRHIWDCCCMAHMAA